MGIDDTSPSAGQDDTLLSPVLRPDVVGGLDQRLQRLAIRASLFGQGVEAVTVGRFRLLDRLGEGGMGSVYAAYDNQLDRKIAIKLIRASSLDSVEAVERTLREARALARVSHPNVVHVYEVGEVEDQLFVAMEFLAGPTLRAWLDQARDRDWREVLAILRQAGEGLAAAHAEGIVHRDFKPQNLMFGADGRVRVLDFGLARLGEEPERQAASRPSNLVEFSMQPITASGALMGTPAYMAPEQLAGKLADVRSDVFGFCVTLFEALYGRRPFVGNTLDEIRDAAVRGQIEPPPSAGVPPWLREVVLRGLAADPERRFGSMPELLAALADDPALRRRRRWAAAAVVGLLGAGGWGLAQAIHQDAPDDDSLRIAAERKALRSGELLDQQFTVDALALAIDAAATFESTVTDAALFQATAADLSWGAIADFTGFAGTLSFSPDGTRLAMAQQNTFMGVEVPVIAIHRLDQGGSTLELRTYDCPALELAFVADGSALMARCFESDDVRVWDANTGAAIAHFAGERDPEFSSSAMRVATREGSDVELGSATSGELVASLAHARAPSIIEFSPDGARLATGGPDQDTRIWDARSGALTTVLTGSNAVTARFFADGSDRVATVGADQQVRIWSIESGELLGELSPPPDRPAGFAAEAVHDLDISPDLTRIALYVDRNIWLWNAGTGELVAALEDQAENPLLEYDNSNPWVMHVRGEPLEFSPDGSRLVTRRHDGTIHLLDGRSGTTVARSNFAWSYSFAPDGDSLAVGTGDFVEIWDSGSGERIRSLPSFIPSFTTFSPDGTRIAARAKNHNGDPSIRLWRITPEPTTITQIAGRVDIRVGVAISADGSRLVTADDVVARVWDAASGVELATLQGHRGPITSMATSAARSLATAGVDGTILLWHLDSGRQHGLLAGHTGAVRRVEFSPDGAVLGSAGDDHDVRLWDAASATPIGDPLAHPGPVTSLRFSPDEARLVTASGGIAYVWDLESRARPLKLAHEQSVWSVAIGHDRIATHDGEIIRLWNSTTGERIHEWTDPGEIPTIEFSPDGRRLASAAALWDVNSGRLITDLEDHDDIDHSSGAPILAPIEFSADGSLVGLRGRVWSAFTGVLVGDFSSGHDEPVIATTFSPTAARVVTASRDAVVIRDAKPPLAAACERLRPYAVAYATVAATCDRTLPTSRYGD